MEKELKIHEMSITVDKNNDFSQWYRQIVLKSNMIKYYDVSGCYVLLPNSYGLWENIKEFLDTQFKKLGVENCYFPLFITKSNMEKEKEHIEGFQPEVAWVTKIGNLEDKGNKDDKEDNNLVEPLAIRPTSECAMYPIFPSLIKSHKDLPLKLNQWCNVVRWEFKDPYPFIRSREFLWQEGHTCFSNKEDATKEIKAIINIYKNCYENLLAVPVIKGVKTEKEKFAGGELTFTLEGFIPEIGKGLQACTAHYLGQNFSKMFEITYQNEKEEKNFIHQNSWGFTTRSIGAMIMTHSDK